MNDTIKTAIDHVLRRSARQVGQKRALAAALICLAATGCVSTPDHALQNAAGAYSDAALPAQAFRFLDWNIKKGQAKHWSEPSAAASLDRRLARVDLATFQEACPPGAHTTLGQRLARAGLSGVFAASFAAPFLACDDGMPTGVFTASRVAPASEQSLVSENREFGLTPKASLATTYPIADRPDRLLVINAHLLNFEWLTLDDYEAQLARLGAVMAGHSGPIILAGDMNSRSRTRTARLQRLVEQAGLTPVFGHIDDARTRAVIGGDMPLDHIFYRGLTIKTAGVIGQETAAGLSDHNSLSVVFSVP